MQSSKFNTAIASLMEYASELVNVHKSSQISKILWKKSLERLLLHLAPLAPHISEELWKMMGNNYSVHQQDIPIFNDSLIVSDKMKIILQVNGKLRDTIEISSELGEKDIKELAMKSENIIKHIADKEIMKTIYVNNRLLNLVVR